MYISPSLSIITDRIIRPVYHFETFTQQTRGIDPMLLLCWPAVFDVGPTWKQHNALFQCVVSAGKCQRRFSPLTLTTLKYFCINYGDRRVFQFEIIVKVLVNSLRFFRMPMLWVCGHYNIFNAFRAGIVFRRQNLPSIDVRFWRVKTVPRWKG